MESQKNSNYRGKSEKISINKVIFLFIFFHAQENRI